MDRRVWPRWLVIGLSAMAAGSVMAPRDQASSSSSPSQRISDLPAAGPAVVAGDRLFFEGNDGTGPEVWTSDGTSRGTHIVRDLWQRGPVPDGRSGGTYPSPHGLTALGDRVIFEATDGLHSGLFAADATDAWYLDVEGGVTTDYEFVPLADRLLFRARSREGYEYRLWSTDGTTSGTGPISDVEPQYPLGSSLRLGGTLFFGATEGGLRYDLWMTNGRSRGTRAVALVGGSVNHPVVAGRDLYFKSEGAGGEIWRFGLDTGEARSVATVGRWAGIVASAGSNLVVWKDENDHRRLFSLIGGSGNLVPLGDLDPGSLECCSRWPPFVETLAVGDRFIFPARDARHGAEMWITDGTASGTELFMDLAPGPAHSNVQRFQPCGDRFVFATYNPDEGNAIWVTDRTRAGTRRQETASALVRQNGFPVGCLGDILLLWAHPPGESRGLFTIELDPPPM